MTIQRRRAYTVCEVERIIRASETRPSLGGDGTGHTGERHVLITNADLADRADNWVWKEMPLACAFAGSPEAARAVTEALNSPEGQAALRYLDATYPTGVRARLEAAVSPLVARYSSGAGVVHTAVVPSVFVLLERTEDPASHGLHIQTAYPILFFRRGKPAWLRADEAWD